MQILFRTQSSIFVSNVIDIQLLDSVHCGEEEQFQFDTRGYYILAIITEYRGTFVTMSKSKKDKVKFERLIREAYKNDKVDLSEFVFVPFGDHEDESEEIYNLRFNKKNGYKIDIPSK